MMEKSSIKWNTTSDNAVLGVIGNFIQHTRLQQNKTQQQTAEAAGINRSTLRDIEKGSGGTLLTLVQILRVLDQLPVLRNFEMEEQVSPLLLAKLELTKRKRARNSNKPDEQTDINPGW